MYVVTLGSDGSASMCILPIINPPGPPIGNVRNVWAFVEEDAVSSVCVSVRSEEASGGTVADDDDDGGGGGGLETI